MIERHLHSSVLEALAESPAVALLGPRQAGKTTLARSIRDAWPKGSVYLDLESPQDRQKLLDAESYLQAHEDKLVILDEVQHMPQLFQPNFLSYPVAAVAGITVWGTKARILSVM